MSITGIQRIFSGRFAALLLGASVLAGCDNREAARVESAAPATPAAATTAGAAAAPARTAAAVETKEGDRVRFALAYPTGDKASSTLLLEKIAPAQVRVGQPYAYDIRVSNLTDAPLSGVTVVESLPASFDFDTSQPTTRPVADGADRAGTMPRWDVGELGPKEAKTIQVTAVPREPGKAAACLAVSYHPTLCTVVEVTNPQLKLTKQGPAQIHRCDKITYTYVVTNAGTGVAKNVRVEETLPDGLTLEDGKTAIALPVGDLPAGQSKEVAVALKASRTGEFASSAVAKSDGDQAQSARLTTHVQEPVLALDVQGPEWRYIGQPVTYTVRIVNNGDAPARDTVLKLNATGLAEDARTRKLGLIKPGQTLMTSVTLDGKGREPLTFAAQASSICAAATDPTAGTVTTAVRMLPALLLETVDNVDPVKIGENTIYTVLVKNQGSAPATNVSVNAELPPELKLVRVSGQSEVKVDGQKLTFAPIASLAPGDVVTWWVEARADKVADTRFKIELNSDYLDRPVPEVEPTRLY